jgi:hypothetical protein
MKNSILRFMKGVMPRKESSPGIAFGFKPYIGWAQPLLVLNLMYGRA